MRVSRRRQKLSKSRDSAGGGIRAGGDYGGRGKRVGVWDAQERGTRTNGGHCWGGGRMVEAFTVPFGRASLEIEAVLVIDMHWHREQG